MIQDNPEGPRGVMYSRNNDAIGRGFPPLRLSKNGHRGPARPNRPASLLMLKKRCHTLASNGASLTGVGAAELPAAFGP
jgi:hypothetical protein